MNKRLLLRKNDLTILSISTIMKTVIEKNAKPLSTPEGMMVVNAYPTGGNPPPAYVPIGCGESGYSLLDTQYFSVRLDTDEDLQATPTIELVGYLATDKENEPLYLFGCNFTNLESRNVSEWKPISPPGFHFTQLDYPDKNLFSMATYLDDLKSHLSTCLITQANMIAHTLKRYIKATA